MDMTSSFGNESAEWRKRTRYLAWVLGAVAIVLGCIGFGGQGGVDSSVKSASLTAKPENARATPAAPSKEKRASSPDQGEHAASSPAAEVSAATPQLSTLEKAAAAFLTSLQLFVLNVSAESVIKGGPFAWGAALLAPLSTSLAVLLAFWPSFVRWRLLRTLREDGPNEVFIGAGDQARAIIAQLLKSRMQGDDPYRLAVLDTTPNNGVSAWLAQHREGVKIFSFTADARDARVLKAAGVGHSNARIWILTGSDACNVEILRQVLALRPGQAVSGLARKGQLDSQSGIQPVLVTVRDEALLRSTLDLWPTLARQAGLEWLHLPRLAALRVLEQHPPHFPLRQQSHALHIAVVGRSEWVEPLLLYLCHHAVYAPEPERAVHISLIAPNAQAQLEALYVRHPLLNPQHRGEDSCQGLLPLAHLHACDASAASLLPSQWQALQQPAWGGAFDTIYVAEAQDEISFSSLRRLAALRDVHAAATDVRPGPSLVVYANDRLARDPHDNGQWPAFARVFDVYAACFGDGKQHPCADLDRLAMLVDFKFDGSDCGATDDDAALLEKAAAHRAQKLADGRLVRPFLWSSRYAASHAQVKQALNAFDGDQTEPGGQWLGRLENRRFAVERLLWNWLPLKGPYRDAPAPSGLPYQQTAPGRSACYEADQKSLLNLNKTLVPQVLLPEAEVEKDLIIVTTTMPVQSPPPPGGS